MSYVTKEMNTQNVLITGILKAHSTTAVANLSKTEDCNVHVAEVSSKHAPDLSTISNDGLVWTIDRSYLAAMSGVNLVGAESNTSPCALKSQCLSKCLLCCGCPLCFCFSRSLSAVPRKRKPALLHGAIGLGYFSASASAPQGTWVFTSLQCNQPLANIQIQVKILATQKKTGSRGLES